MDTTDIEKKSLEAHVELCAERYRYLEEKLETVEKRVTELTYLVGEIKDLLQDVKEKRNNQLINWAVGIIATLTTMVGYLVSTYMFK